MCFAFMNNCHCSALHSCAALAHPHTHKTHNIQYTIVYFSIVVHTRQTHTHSRNTATPPPPPTLNTNAIIWQICQRIAGTPEGHATVRHDDDGRRASLSRREQFVLAIVFCCGCMSYIVSCALCMVYCCAAARTTLGSKQHGRTKCNKTASHRSEVTIQPATKRLNKYKVYIDSERLPITERKQETTLEQYHLYIVNSNGTLKVKRFRFRIAYIFIDSNSPSA